MPWGVAAAGISALGSIGSGIMNSNASKSAAQTQANSTNAATATELGMYNQNVAREAPFVSAGTNALPGLLKLLGLDSSGGGTPSSPIMNMLGLGQGGTGQIDPSTFQGSPGYQYQVQQGNNAITNMAHGNLGGNALRALQANGQQLANQNWNQYLSNANGAYQGLVGNVSNVVGSGQNAANFLGTAGQGVAGQIGGNTIGAGNAMAGGIVGGAKNLSGGINGAAEGLGSILQSQAFKDLFKGSSSIDPNALAGTSNATAAPGAWGSWG